MPDCLENSLLVGFGANSTGFWFVWVFSSCVAVGVEIGSLQYGQQCCSHFPLLFRETPSLANAFCCTVGSQKETTELLPKQLESDSV